MLPIESKLIHCRWTGESTWIPFGDFRPGPRLREPHLAPGAGPARDLPGRHQRVRDLLPVRRLHDGVEGRPAGGQPLRDGRSPTTAGQDRLREIGRRCLWEGAQAIRSARSTRLTRPGGSSERDVTDLLIRGGTVVTADRLARVADLAVEAAGSTAIEPDLSGLRDRRRARSSTRPGCSSCPASSTSTPTRASPRDAEPDRFFQDSVAAAFGGTTTFLAFNNPGTGSSPAAERSLLTGAARVARRDRRRQRDRLRPEPRRSAAGWTTRSPSCRRRSTRASRPSKAFMVFDFRLADRAPVRRDAA